MTDSGEFDARPVRAFLPGPGTRPDETRWPASVPAMGQLLREGLELSAGLTVLVGENGSGKSTVMETLAEAYGLNPQGGSAHGQTFRIRPSEPGIGGELSHGEGFLEILRTRVNETGFYLLDEPDAPLSFTASLGLAALLHDLTEAGS
jgi:predicted ATPase